MAGSETDAGRAPLGAWWRLYLVCAFAALVVLALLWWFTAAFNIPMGLR